MQDLVIIGGGTSGLGLELAKIFLRNKNKVLIIGKNKDKAKNVMEHLKNEFSEQILCLSGNLAMDSFVSQIEEIVKNYNVSTLINCAGAEARCKIGEIKEQFVKDSLEANVISSVLLTSMIIKHLKKGVIVNVMSSAGLKGNANESVYCLSKWAMRGFSQALKAENDNKDVKILDVFPSGMNTSFWDNCAEKPNVKAFMNPYDVAVAIYSALPKDGINLAISELIIEKR